MNVYEYGSACGHPPCCDHDPCEPDVVIEEPPVEQCPIGECEFEVNQTTCTPQSDISNWNEFLEAYNSDNETCSKGLDRCEFEFFYACATTYDGIDWSVGLNNDDLFNLYDDNNNCCLRRKELANMRKGKPEPLTE